MARAAPDITETILSDDFRVRNGLDIVVATFGSADLAWAFITPAEVKRRGPLHVDHVVRVERREAVRRLRRVA